MTTYVINDRPLTGADGHERRTLSPLMGWLEGMSAKLTRWWAWHRAYRHTLRELEGLNDKELDDIGVVRIDIPMIALEAASKTQAVR